jgi:hypothetical protein
MHKRLLGGFAGLGLAIVAALGLGGRNGFGDDPDIEVMPRMPALAGATGWINTPPLTAAALRGKVVLVEILTYSCINWRRQLPYVRAWAERYAADGLVVLGVHSPEFGFEHAADNVQRAARTIRIPFPIAIDSDMAIWNALDNSYWPALYFIDAQGRIRHHVFGEGEYESSEMIIRQLLAEAGHPPSGELATIDARGVEAAPDVRNLLTPETYAGYARMRGFASPGGAVRDEGRRYVVPAKLALAQWALAGAWTMGPESAVLDAAGGRVVYRFHARDLHVVMGSHAGTPVRFRVRIDGQPPGASHGEDVDDQGQGTMIEPRLYQLIRQHGPIIEREVEIELPDPGAELFSFTFG